MTSPRNRNDSASPRDLELQRKRARDRKSQQAMRDRNKYTIQSLSEQVACLSAALEERTQACDVLEAKLGFLETENAQLRTQNAALQLSLMGRDGLEGDGQSPGVVSSVSSLGPPGGSCSRRTRRPGVSPTRSCRASSTPSGPRARCCCLLRRVRGRQGSRCGRTWGVCWSGTTAPTTISATSSLTCCGRIARLRGCRSRWPCFT